MQPTAVIRRAIAIANIVQEFVIDKPGIQEYYDRFPRDMEAIIVLGLEIPVISLADLTVQRVAGFLGQLYGLITPTEPLDDRPLHGLLHVGLPSNLIFIRDGLPLHIRNYILAHELGHFLADVFLVRQLWLKTMPEQKEAIQMAFTWRTIDAHLDLYALIKGLPNRPRTITDRGRAMPNETAEREIQADLIARELQAPWHTVAGLFQPSQRTEMVTMIYRTFGLPKRIAAYYYDDLQHYMTPRRSVVDRLFAPLLATSEPLSQMNDDKSETSSV